MAITKVTFLDDELYIDHVYSEICNTLQTSLFCFVFFFQFCDVATVVMRSQEELAKFGYRLKRKVENFKNHAIFLRARTYCLNMAISETIPSKSGNFGAKNPSYELH